MKQAANDVNAKQPPVTTRRAFWSVDSGSQHLLSVNAGVDAATALQQASCFMDVGKDLAKAIGGLSDDELKADREIVDIRQLGWACAYFLELSKAIVDAIDLRSAEVKS